jgi:hypothetical protein
MSFAYSWDDAFESLPDNNTYGYLIDDYFRQLYVAIRERMQVDHIWKVGETDGGHNKVSLAKQTGAPLTTAAYGFIYTKDVGSGVIELFYKDAAGNEVQLTGGGLSTYFPAATKMPFYMNVAPLGWTIDTTLDDKLLFVTKGSGAGGQTGGGAHSTGSWTISGITNQAVTLTAGQSGLRDHIHSVTYTQGTAGGQQTNPTGSGPTATFSANTNAVVGGALPANDSHNHSTSQDGTWRPPAYCVILASKN